MLREYLVAPTKNFLDAEAMSAARASQRKRPATRYRGGAPVIIAMLIACMAALWTGVYLHLEAERELVGSQSRLSAENVAKGIAEQASTLSSSVDKLMLIFRLLLRDGRDPRDIIDLQNLGWMNLGFIAQVAIADADGVITDTNLGPLKTPVSIADRIHFTVHKNSTEDRLFISDPVIGRVSESMTIQFSRPLRDDHGRFRGVIVVSVATKRLVEFFRTIKLPFGGWISLVNNRGIIVADAMDAEDSSMIGKNVLHSDGIKEALPERDTCRDADALINGRPMLICIVKVRDYPLWITVATPKSAIYEGYNLDRTNVIAYSAGFSALLTILAVIFAHRDWSLWKSQRVIQVLVNRELEKATEISMVLSSIDEGLLIISPDGEILAFNRKTLDILDIPAAPDNPTVGTLVGAMTRGDASPPNTHELVVEALTAPRDEISSGALSINNRSIEVRTFTGSDGNRIKVLRDISEQIRSRDALRQAALSFEKLSEKRAEFLAIFSHEIRTPLHAIIGYSKLLAETELDESQRQLLDAVMSPASHLRAIVGDVLDFVTLDSDGMALNEGPLDLFQICDRIAPIATTLIGSRDIRFQANIPHDIPMTLLGDEKRLFQLLINIVGNAIKYTDKGLVTFDVKILERSSDNIALRFIVTDTGQGIDASDLGRIFAPFERGMAAQGPQEGTGLGLAICAKIIKRMNGSIKIDSAVGVGTSILFDIPLRLAAPRALTAGKTNSAAVSLDILVAEDNRASRILIERLMNRLGHRVTTAENGKVALDASKAARFDLILMDLQMPVLDGWSATREIRKISRERGERPFIVALTAQALRSDRQAAMEAGFDGFLEKPIVDEELTAILARASALHNQPAS